MLLHLDGDWMYVGGRAAGGRRRVRRKLSDENANSFLVKEEKVWCRIFCPGGSETAAYDDADCFRIPWL